MITLNERQPVDSDLGPGLELKAARERKGMSLNEVADALHLRPSIVDAIENGNYDLLPGQIFLKGYVRSYARLVGMDEERAISALQNQLASRQVETADVVDEKRPVRFWIPVLLVLIAAAGGAIYWFSGSTIVSFDTQPSEEKQPGISGQESPLFQKDGEKKGDEQTVSNAMSEVSGSPDVEGQSDPVAAEHDDLSAPATKLTESISPPEEEAEEIHSPVVIVENEPTTESEPVLSEPKVDTSDESTELSDTAADPEEQTATTVAETQVDVGKIEMTFSGDSWVTVHNGNDKRVIAALKRAGQTSVYEGPLPFKLVVGDVSVTKLSFNGSSVNWQDYRVRNNRAELELR